MVLPVVALVVRASTPTPPVRPLVRLVPVAKGQHRVPKLHRNVPRVTLMACNLATNPRVEPAVSFPCSVALFLCLIFDPAATANTIAASGRARRARSDVDCHSPYKKCAISGLEGASECVDVQANAESCGGCAGAGGMDCTSISKATADCILGSCVIRMSPRVFTYLP